MYGCLLEGKRHQSLAKPDKLKFSNEPKQTELAKQKHGVNTMHTKTCETFDMSFATPQSTALLYFKKKKLFYRTQHIMPFRNNSVKQNRLEDQNWKKRWWKCHMFKCCHEPQASIKPVNDCHQMTFLTTRSIARILIRYLCHRHGLPLRCPAVLLGGGGGGG